MTTMPESFFGWVTFLLHQYGDVLLKGACVTLLLAIVGTLIGCVIGLVVGIIQTIPEDPKASAAKKALVKVTQLVLNAYVELFRGTPMIVQAMVVYYGAMSMFNIDMSPMFAGFLVVSINTGAIYGRKLYAAVLNRSIRVSAKLLWLSAWIIFRRCAV